MQAGELSLVQPCPSGHLVSAGARGPGQTDNSSSTDCCKQTHMSTPSFKWVYQSHSCSVPTSSVLHDCAMSVLWLQDVTPGGLGTTSTSTRPGLLTSQVETWKQRVETTTAFASLPQWHILMGMSGSLIISSLYMIQHHLCMSCFD